MKQFFGAFFGSMLGVVVATLLAVLLLAAIVRAGMSAAFKDRKNEAVVVMDKTVLRLKLEGELPDREKDNPFKELGEASRIFNEGGYGLNSLLLKLDAASKDNDVKGIYLTFDNLRGGFATLRELRGALQRFRDKGKFIYAYSEEYSQQDYYIASVANRIFINPEGNLEWKGLGMTMMFFRQTIEKLDLDMQVFRHGKFKSAVEPFLLDKMSEANRLQSEGFLSSIWQTMVSDIAASRKMDESELNAMADRLAVRHAPDAEGTLVDRLAYEDEVIAELKSKIGVKGAEKLRYLDLASYTAKVKTEIKAGRPKIAVIYASGSIGGGEGSDDQVGSERLARTIRDARQDEKIKAIVLRVNSPGGSAMASEVIWREMHLAQKAKPTIVSMGNMAASGGYYISCAAGRIFAQPNTITGSIGVFGVIPNLQRMLEKKFGITVDTVNTNKYSDIATGLRPVSEYEREYIQASVEKVYDTFTKRVAEGRKMSQAQVDSIGQGRVWSGSDALRLGLVDEIGGMEAAVAYAAKAASVSDYKLVELPRQRGPFDGLFGAKEMQIGTAFMKQQLGIAYPVFLQLRELMSLKGVQARLPFEVSFY